MPEPNADVTMLLGALLAREQERLTAYAEQAVAQEREACAADVPTTWLDPLLTGPRAVLPGHGPWDGLDVERLLRAIAAKIRQRATPPPGGEETT